MAKAPRKNGIGARAGRGDQVVISQCLEIIAPDAHHEDSCRRHVELALNFFALDHEERLNGTAFEKFYAESMREVAYTLSQAAEVMKAHPWPHLLQEKDMPDPWSAAALDDFSACYDEWSRLATRIASIAQAAQKPLHVQPRRRTRPV